MNSDDESEGYGWIHSIQVYMYDDHTIDRINNKYIDVLLFLGRNYVVLNHFCF